MEIEEYTVEDLSEKLQENYWYMLKRVHRPEEWGLIALNLQPIEMWEKYRFGLFCRKDFIDNVDAIYNGLWTSQIIKKVAALEKRVAELEEQNGSRR